MDLFVTLKFTGSLDTLPGGSNLDENAFLGDADGLVKLDQVLGLHKRMFRVTRLFEQEIGATCEP